MEADCDFCPGCGAAKPKSNQRPTNTREPHSWMRDTPAAAPAVVSAPLMQPVPAPQIQYVPVATPAPVITVQDSGLAATVRTMGIVAIALMLIGFIPCLGWLNYLNLTFSFLTVILSIVALASAKSDSARSSAIIGLALVVVAICLGVGRLIIGGGCL
jgi:hypothetical protein